MSRQLTRCWAEIDQSALAHNVQLLQTIGPEVMAVVKADAYGHGISFVVETLLKLNIRRFAVATLDEAEELRKMPDMSGRSIYLMAAVLPEDAEDVLALDVVPLTGDDQFVAALSQACTARNETATVHLDVDTGIGRAGVLPRDFVATLERWRSLPGITVTGVCTHFTAADAVGADDALGQQRLFRETLKSVAPGLLEGVVVHSSNSPAAVRLEPSGAELFRPGLLLYGIPPSPQFVSGFPYLPALTLKARVLLVRRLPAGSDISYSRTYRLPADATIATIGIGYGDGYPRRLSNVGMVQLPGGELAPIRGRVCMDQLCVELPQSSPVTAGSVVTLIGGPAGGPISVSSIADLIDETPHELTTCLTKRVPRVAT